MEKQTSQEKYGGEASGVKDGESTLSLNGANSDTEMLSTREIMEQIMKTDSNEDRIPFNAQGHSKGQDKKRAKTLMDENGRTMYADTPTKAAAAAASQLNRIPGAHAYLGNNTTNHAHKQGLVGATSKVPLKWYLAVQHRNQTHVLKGVSKQRQPSMYYENPRNLRQNSCKHSEAIESRPPLDYSKLQGPDCIAYKPSGDIGTAAPAWSFGKKTLERPFGLGARTAWAKTWMSSMSYDFKKLVWLNKVDLERQWPSPEKYNPTQPEVGQRHATTPNAPAFSVRGKDFSTDFVTRSRDPHLTHPNNKKHENEEIERRKALAASLKLEPPPSKYNTNPCTAHIKSQAPAFSFGNRGFKGTILWPKKETTPGPESYDPRLRFVKTSSPAITITGLRGFKRHTLGPFASL